VPACAFAGAPCAGAVKAGRRAWLAPRGHAARPRLDGPSTARGSSRLGRRLIGPDALEGAPVVQNRPGDAGELVGKRNRQHVVVQPLFRRLDPGLEPIAVPLLWPELDQYDPGRLNE